ncbi:MAG UNVERIFIED_CONTAM: hypothetical protein LVR29_20460 [Microcystis novacekii LVE1205-3]|jgi:hypothetical protein
MLILLSVQLRIAAPAGITIDYAGRPLGELQVLLVPRKPVVFRGEFRWERVQSWRLPRALSYGCGSMILRVSGGAIRAVMCCSCSLLRGPEVGAVWKGGGPVGGWGGGLMLGIAGILASLTLLMLLAYRGASVIVLAPVCLLLAVAADPGTPLLAGYTQVFMPGVGRFIRSIFRCFCWERCLVV